MKKGALLSVLLILSCGDSTRIATKDDLRILKEDTVSDFKNKASFCTMGTVYLDVNFSTLESEIVEVDSTEIDASDFLRIFGKDTFRRDQHGRPQYSIIYKNRALGPHEVVLKLCGPGAISAVLNQSVGSENRKALYYSCVKRCTTRQ